MSVTSTQSNTPGRAQQVAVGSYIDTGTAAAYVITVGFQPRYVRVENETDRNGMEWFEGMADAEAVRVVAAGTRTLITSRGITVSDKGFTVGADTKVNVQSKQISWIAFS